MISEKTELVSIFPDSVVIAVSSKEQKNLKSCHNTSSPYIKWFLFKTDTDNKLGYSQDDKRPNDLHKAHSDTSLMRRVLSMPPITQAFKNHTLENPQLPKPQSNSEELQYFPKSLFTTMVIPASKNNQHKTTAAVSKIFDSSQTTNSLGRSITQRLKRQMIDEETFTHLDICATESFEAKCPLNQVIFMKWALYGRIEESRCVSNFLDQLGCYSDVILIMDQSCSGRRFCEIHVPNAELESTNICIKELQSFLRISYECVTG